jgi:transposase-like protein
MYPCFARFLLIFSLASLCALCWSYHGPAQSRSKDSVRNRLPRVLKPRCPDDCPACRLASPALEGAGPVPAPVRPWCEVKSRRGVPKHIDTQGFACPNPQCPYLRVTDACIHALVGDGKHGRAERIQTFRCQACRITFSARLHTPLYRLKTPSQQIAMVLSALAEGLDPSSAERVFGFRQATITTWLLRAGEHAHTLHERFFCHLHLPHLQLDEVRTRLRCARQVLWLWLAIDPCTKLLPVLHLGPRTQHMAHLLIHSLRDRLAAFLPSTLYERRAQPLLLCSHGPLWSMAGRRSERAPLAPVAGSGRPDLWSGEEKLPTAQAGGGFESDAAWNTGRSPSRLTRVRLLRTVEHGFYRASEPDGPTWGGSAGSPHLGHSIVVPTPVSPPRVVACLLPFCTPTRITASSARAAARARRQTIGATLSVPDACDGSGENPSTLDDARGALVPLAKGSA